jgi:hypothetical protein
MALTANDPIEEGLDQPSIDEKRALIARVAASAQFARSARLRDFLLYVGSQSLKEGCPEIHEQEIGAKVFGRSALYDRSQDNIVRVNATELRKRIDHYFATEGAQETLIIEIPRGGYRPVFRHRPPETPSPSHQPAEELSVTEANPAATPALSPSSRLLFLWPAATLALAILCAFLVQQNRAMQHSLSPWDGKPVVAAFWTDFLSSHQQTDIVLPDDSVSVIEDIIHRPISLGDYLDRGYMRQIQASDLSQDRKYDLDQVSFHNLVTFGGVRAAQQFLALIPASSSSHLTLSRYYVADAIKRDNVILIGGKKANPWVHLFEDQMNFITDYDHAHGQAFVNNRNPKPGEPSTYLAPHDPEALFGYSVITYLPNLSRTGNVIIVAGTDSDATDAAAEFLSSEDQLEKFRSTLHLQKLPYFEVLLKTSRLSGTSLNAQMVAYRTYPILH